MLCLVLRQFFLPLVPFPVTATRITSCGIGLPCQHSYHWRCGEGRRDSRPEAARGRRRRGPWGDLEADIEVRIGPPGLAGMVLKSIVRYAGFFDIVLQVSACASDSILRLGESAEQRKEKEKGYAFG